MTSSVLENARVVEHDQVVAKTLAFVKGRVAEAPANAFRVDLRDHVIFPGLINAHDHLQLNHIPPLAHAEPFSNSYAWIDAFESHLREPGVIAATRTPSDARHWQGGLKNLLAGATTVAHHDPWHAVLDVPDFPVNVLRNFGWSHSLGLGEASGGLTPRYGPPVAQSFVATSREHPWIIHLAEGTDDVAGAELARLAALGCLAPNTVLVHGVGLRRSDVERVIECGAAVVWCPASNLAMLGRTLEPWAIRRLFTARRLTLGSDSRLTGSRDLLEELRVASSHSDLSANELVQLVTGAASRILRMPECGGSRLGQRADFVIVRARIDAHRALFEAGRSEIRVVVRGGVPVIADVEFAEWFVHCGVAFADVQVDGRPKLIDQRLVCREVTVLEPGLVTT